ncbi:MAG: hypothetical protein ACLFV8_14720 [Alphaproteobacteria bacterium]
MRALAVLGDSDRQITELTYARYHPDYLRAAARALAWILPG